MDYDENRVARIAKTITVAFKRYNLNETSKLTDIAMKCTDGEKLSQLADNLLNGDKNGSIYDVLIHIANNPNTPKETREKVLFNLGR